MRVRTLGPCVAMGQSAAGTWDTVTRDLGGAGQQDGRRDRAHGRTRMAAADRVQNGRRSERRAKDH